MNNTNTVGIRLITIGVFCTPPVDDGAKPHRVEPLVYDAGYRPARYSFVIYKIDKTKLKCGGTVGDRPYVHSK